MSNCVSTAAHRGTGDGEIKVSQDGTKDYRTVQDAIDAIPPHNTRPTVIRVWPGIYKQTVHVPKTKNHITIAGLSPENTVNTVLTWHYTADTKIDHQKESIGTFKCGSTIVEGEDFIAQNITFENSAPQGSHQAVAIRVSADRCAFYKCRFLGWQDTLYLHKGKQYLKECYIEGSVDFIFGNSTALLEDCKIHCKSAGFITAQSRNSSQETTGFVFSRCQITGNGGTSYAYLGRPWKPYGRVVFADTWMDACIKPDGWNNWDKTENERTACFYEYRCSGPGSSRSKRVKWARELVDKEAEQFVTNRFIDSDQKSSWLAQVAVRIPNPA
ncbi:pectinesterase 31-like [Cornus florida]|uniref:pectinesterase 31-like n=1 Tax=Cornus florida TaxID=4283 RepID=UPI00289E94F5|nr:pectinesterase 31-like [Cornus florida]